MNRCAIYFAAVAGCISFNTAANATYVINVNEVGNDIVITGSGFLNTSGLSFRATSVVSGNSLLGSNFLTLGSGFTDAWNLPANTYIGGADSINSSSTGNFVGFGNEYLFVPQGYVSGADLGISTATYLNSTFNSLTLTQGSRSINWGEGRSADNIIINIGAAVPEPSTWAMMLLGFFGVGVALRRRRKTAAYAHVA